jgi:DNA repair exonuclease SbcCD ATPase subunit
MITRCCRSRLEIAKLFAHNKRLEKWEMDEVGSSIFRGGSRTIIKPGDFLSGKGYSSTVPLKTFQGIMITTKRFSWSARDCGKLKSAIVNSLACLAVITSGGCVMNSTYNAAVEEAQAVKGELERTKEEQRILSRQVSELEKLNAESLRDIEVIAAEAEQEKTDADRQRREAEEQQAKLRQKIPQLIRQHGTLQDDLAVERKNQAALQELIEVYKKKVADLRNESAVASSPEVALAPKPFDPAALPPAQTLPEPVPAAEPLKPEPAPPMPATPPAAVAPPATTEQKSEPSDSGLLSTIKGWIVSLWHLVFP